MLGSLRAASTRAVAAWEQSVTRTMTGLFIDRGADKLAQGMLAGIFPGGTGHPPARGARPLLAAYATMPWLRAVVHKIANAMAATEWQVLAVRDPRSNRARRVRSLQKCYDYRTRAQALARYQAAGELEVIEEHPLLDALDASNPIITGLTNRALTQVYMELVGEFFWIKERGTVENGRTKRKVVTGLWTVPPTWIINTPTPNNPFFHVSYRGWQRHIPASEIIWATDPNPLDPYARGVGTAMSLADELETDEYAAKHCHDPETEALTRRGWVRGLELRRDDEIATWNETLGRIEYHRPLDIVEFDHAGTMHHWTGPGVDVLVTPNHRLWIERRGLYNKRLGRWTPKPEPWHFEESRVAQAKPGRRFRWRDAGFYDGQVKTVEIPGVDRITKRRSGSRGGGRPPRRGVNDPLRFDVHAFAPFLGYYISEGNAQAAGLQIAQSEGAFVDSIRAALGIFPADWVRETSRQPAYKWLVHHLGLTEWLRRHVGDGAANKRLPAEVFEWPVSAQRLLLEAMVDGDGSRPRTWPGSRGMIYFTASPGLAGDVQRLCVQLGWSSRISSAMSRTTRMYRVGIRPNRNMRELSGIVRQGARPRQWVEDVPYTGRVWCVTVPNEVFVTRRNGCVMLGGNTRNFFLNRARPELIVTTDPTQAGAASPDELDVLKQRWLNETLGYNRSWKPFFVNRKLDIHELEQNFRNLQLVQLREHERNVIMQTWGIPPEVLGVLSSSNRATIDAADLFMGRYVLMPRLEFMRTIIQERLAPEYDERIVVHYVSPVAEDREFKLRAFAAMPATPTVDEWRAIQDLEPHEDKKVGKMHLMPGTVMPVEEIKEPEPPPMDPAGLGGPPPGAAKPAAAPAEKNGHVRWARLSSLLRN